MLKFKKVLMVCGVLICLKGIPVYACVDYSQQINSDFTDGLKINYTHMCGKSRHYGDVVELDTGVPYVHKESIETMIVNLLPRGLVDSFRYSGHKLILTNKDIRGYEGGDIPFEPGGMYSRATKKLYLSNKYNNFWAEDSVVHEFGHYLDYTVGDITGVYRVSKEKEFMQIWEKERYNLKVDYTNNLAYYQNTVTEYFAQAFEEYLKNPDRLQQNTPGTYAYLSKCLKILDMSTPVMIK